MSGVLGAILRGLEKDLMAFLGSLGGLVGGLGESWGPSRGFGGPLEGS